MTTTKRRKNSETDFGVNGPNSETKGLAERIRRSAELIGGGDALAQKAAIPRRTLETYLSGNAEPKVRRVVDIAHATGVRVAWLADGDGPMMSTESSRDLESALLLKDEAAPYRVEERKKAVFARLREVGETLRELEQESGFEPSPYWREMLKTLMFSQRLNREGAARLLDALQRDLAPKEKSEGD